MLRLGKIGLVVMGGVFLVMSAVSNAAFVHTDWLALGDQRAVLDTQSGLEWLNLTESQNMSLLDIEAATAPDQTEHILRHWRLPTHDEVAQMFANLFPQIGFTDLLFKGSILRPEVEHFIGLFGATYVVAPEVNASYEKFSSGVYLNKYEKSELKGSMILHATVTLESSQNEEHPHEIVINQGRSNHSHIPFEHNGWFLVSEGGTTLTSLNDPSINTPVPEVQDVSLQLLFSPILLMFIPFVRRRKIN